MAYHNIEWSAGETQEGAVALPGIYTQTLCNVFLDDQKQPRVREANEFLVSFTPPNGRYLNSYLSEKRNWFVIASVVDTSVYINIYDLSSGTKTQIIMDNPTSVTFLFFLEIGRDQFSAGLNNVVGDTAILLSGMNLMYFLDSDKTFKQFNIKTALTTSTPVYKPAHCCLFQSRLSIICEGPNLTGDNPTSSNSRILFSKIYDCDDFTIGLDTDPIEVIEAGSIDVNILTSADEVLYCLSSVEEMLIVTTNRGLRVVKSSDETDTVLVRTRIINYIGGYGNSVRSPSIPFAGFLIFATTFTLRAKMLQSLETDYINTIDLVLPLLTNFTSKVTGISMDYSNQNLMVFLDDGTVRCISPQCMVPSKSYNLSLPTTTTYISDGLQFLHLTEHNPIYMLIATTTYAGEIIYTLSRKYEEVNNFGYLLDGVKTFVWRVTVGDVNGNSFNVTNLSDNTNIVTGLNAISYGLQAAVDTTLIQGMWLKVGSNWYYFVNDTYPKFTTEVSGSGITNGQVYDAILVCISIGYKLLPPAFQHLNSYLELKFNLVGSDNVEYNFSYFHRGPIDGFGNLNIPSNISYTGSIVCRIAVGTPQMIIGWRDVDCIDNMKNAGGIRCTLLCNINNITEYILFSVDNSSISIQENSDHSEIEFQTNLGDSYTEKKVYGFSSQVKASTVPIKFFRLLGQY